MKSNKDIAGSKAKTPLSRLRPRHMGWKGLMAWTVGMLVFKMLYFDFIWALGTTFSGFQFPLGYVTKIGLASLLMLPLLWARRRWYVITICVLIDLWLVANLMYFRTYFTIIPASSYGLVGNLADFTDSVWESLRWADLGFPATTAILIIAIAKTDLRAVITGALRQCSLRPRQRRHHRHLPCVQGRFQGSVPRPDVRLLDLRRRSLHHPRSHVLRDSKRRRGTDPGD